jgi:hypothetical protein
MIKTTIAAIIPIAAALYMFTNIFAQSALEHSDASINDLRRNGIPSSHIGTNEMNAFLFLFAFALIPLAFPVGKALADDNPMFQRGGNNHNDDDNDKPEPTGTHVDHACTASGSCCKGTSFCREKASDNGDDKKNDTKFFRGHNNEIKEILVIPQMNFATTTNGTTAANVTIPVCNGVVGGPCLDPNTHTIIT